MILSFKIIHRLLFVLAIILLSSCAYYNTFYNAKKFYESAQSKPLTNKGKASSQAIEEYNKVIKKCGVILTDYKDSKWADDALFLLAKALYYRGNNELQSLEKFEDILKFYPDSPFVSESHIFIAQINYDLNKKNEAYKMLQDFIQRNEFKEDHPKALVLISDLYIRDKQYLDAQFYLQMLIEKFPKSKEYPNAYFLLGKTYFDNKDYTQSLKVYKDLINARIDKTIKLSANYYVAYNQYYLKNFSLADQTIKKLIKNEFRDNMFPSYYVLRARIIAETESAEASIEEFGNIIKNNPRTEFSAESCFYTGELYFSKIHNYEKAIEFYNKVKTELSTSVFVERSIVRSSIASQIIQLRKHNSDIPLETLINEQFKLAEYYMYELDLPDSALVIYKKIPQQKEELIQLKNKISEKKDFLPRFKDVVGDSIQIDSLLTLYNTSFQDSLMFRNAFNDSLFINHVDSLITTFNQRIDNIDKDVNQYQEQFIPLSYFVQMVIYDIFYKGSDEIDRIYQILIDMYPDNRYKIAADDYINKREVDFLTQQEKELYRNYEEALELIYHTINDTISSVIPIESGEEDSTQVSPIQRAILLLNDISLSEHDELALKSLFTLGITYYIDLNDSLSAKSYLDQVLQKSPQSNYALFIKNIYDGSKFIKTDTLQSVIEIERYELEKKNAQSDSLKQDADSTGTNPLEIESEEKINDTGIDRIEKINDGNSFNRFIIKEDDLDIFYFGYYHLLV